MQTNDTLMVVDKEFNDLEEQELEKADFNAKLKETLTVENEVTFNRGTLKKLANGSILLKQKDQGKKLELVIENGNNYLEQRARAAYIASLSTEEKFDSSFLIQRNLIAASSTKCKRVIRLVLASEIYGIVSGVDIAICVATTLKIITNKLEVLEVLIVVYTDSYSLYECFIKLGTIKEKRLMIDIMALRQSYERRELAKVRWIKGKDNLADSITKINPNKSLATFIDTNKANVRVEG
ncbi:hypothetical protein MBM_04656 [Drepanopeziza brunnea f. sp. 'multigermtubi' MB_m1]|uniref:Polyprotein n=1 Tax=Marssonina brunnea f. sp. multigermtubi (strain MB_m1) TaxID=1072389 RepID=K1XWG1_MARBU|nr:uncharacterized protein MBM_04656 [Drepanopeziza brunnea f. sp. 'multigermtubi' MB_m1]EKD17079.1 hypothetical protein MBM_04656 [Drepanopeziza brunnea f. sp. 'multigermtubi' MB_m1]